MTGRWLRRLCFCAGVSEIRLRHVAHVALIPSCRVRQPNRSPRHVGVMLLLCRSRIRRSRLQMQSVLCITCVALRVDCGSRVDSTYSLFLRCVPYLRGDDSGAAFGCASAKEFRCGMARGVVWAEGAKDRPSEAEETALLHATGSSASAGDVRFHYAQIMMGPVDLLLGVVIRGGSVAGAATSRRRRGSGIAAS
ncbi:hypothetical protein CQR44_1363 [Bifidobacterium asteroides]|uniref:Uncharacterized protein n=1 Tax=Bifidobacterium asteroides TaxID=1684 RepID=A0A2N3R9M6_9BIFI|nr:hypothetical protein CQR44_1363 [Bifidobacterium asteroides]